MPEPQCEVAETSSGIQYCDYLQGEGPAPAKGDVVRCHYTLRLASGRPVDSSYNRGQPLQFTVGVGQVIKGWDIGILGDGGCVYGDAARAPTEMHTRALPDAASVQRWQACRQLYLVKGIVRWLGFEP